jgi:hypothetical protein
MPFVKISDPNIVDLAAWQQVINVVNQHTDSINAITNNFGVSASASGPVDWNADNDVVHEYNSGTEKLLYGRFKINTVDNDSNINDGQIFYGTINFIDDGTTAFSARPIVTATMQFGHADIAALDDRNHNIICNIFAVTDSKFEYRVTRATSTDAEPDPLTGFFYISWQAIGPK